MSHSTHYRSFQMNANYTEYSIVHAAKLQQIYSTNIRISSQSMLSAKSQDAVCQVTRNAIYAHKMTRINRAAD